MTPLAAVARVLARPLYALAVRVERLSGRPAGPDHLAAVHPLPPRRTGRSDGWGDCGPRPVDVPPPPPAALLAPTTPRPRVLREVPAGVERDRRRSGGHRDHIGEEAWSS